MATLIHHLVQETAGREPHRVALGYRGQSLDYETLWRQSEAAANAFAALGLTRGERVGIYLEKRFETVIAMLGVAAAGCVFVPINPVLKPRQVTYILRDCNVRFLVTSAQR